MDFKIVLACDSNYGIGCNNNSNSIPWKISDDMKRFKKITTSTPNDDTKFNAIIMGRITADTFQKPLNNRLNVVITSRENYRTEEGFVSYRTLTDALKELKNNENIYKVFVIGGAKLVEDAVDNKYCRGTYLTRIHEDYQCDVRISKHIVNRMVYSQYKYTTKSIESLCKTKNHNVSVDFIDTHYQNREETAYLVLLENILKTGDFRQTRNAMTYSLFGEKLEFNMDNGFPLLTSKKMFTRGILEELIFFLRGYTNTKILEDKRVMIWHDNTTPDFMKKYNKQLEPFDMGPMYGFQWRYFNAPYKGCHECYNGLGVDQLQDVIDKLTNDPHSRRILMTTYNPAQSEQGVLYPCHGIIVQFYVEQESRISLQMYQR